MKKPLESRLDAPAATGKKPLPEAVVNTIEYEGPAEKKQLTSPPPSLTSQFTVVANRYYFKDRPDQEAFVDHGERLRTQHNRSPVAKAMLDLAESRGWETIKVNGNPEFKQAVWLEASLKGIAVTGYTPTPQDQAALRTRQQEQGQATIRPSASPTSAPAASPTPAPPAPAKGSEEWYAARRERFATAQQQAAQQRESRQATIRDQVMQQSRVERQQQEAQAQAEQRRQAQQQEKAVQLREAVDTLDKRSALQAHPELARFYPLLAEAENFAKAHLRPENQPEFIEQIKERSLQELARGETLPKLPNVTEKASSQDRSQERAAEVEL